MQVLAVVVMGVSSSGKTTIGEILAKELGWDFFDADDFHPPENRKKMSSGIPLTDEDREEWLNALNGLLQNCVEVKTPCVLACSALKQKYRDKLAVSQNIQFVYLRGSYDQIETRMKRRKGHYMPVQLLQSQFEALEEPRDAVIVNISLSPEEIVQSILKGIKI